MLIHASPLLSLLLLHGAPARDNEPVLHTASTHPMRYWVVEPTSEPASGEQPPVLVCLPGSDAEFRVTAQRYAKARGDSPVRIVVPRTFSSSNLMRGEIGQRYREAYGEDVVAKVGGEGLFPDVRTRIKWDEEGIIAILKDLGYGPGLPGRVYFTGFSGGGFLSWCMILRHPELFAGVVPVCPNFAWWTVSSDDASSGTRTTRVRVLRGQSDPLRSCRARGVPVPPLGVTLAFAPILGAGAGYVAWLRWKRVGRVAAVVLLVAILTTGLCVGRMSGLDFQADRAAALMAAVGQPVEWEEIPGMGHDAAPVRVLEVVADWERQQPGHSSQ